MNAPLRYTRGAIALHWVHALVVLGLIGWGLWMADLPKGPERGWAFGIHKSFGLIAIVLIVLRGLWRLRNPPPPNPALSPLERRVSNIAHRLLYVLLVAVPAAGLTSVSFTKYPLKFFGIPLPKPGFPDETLNAIFSTTHQWLAWTLAALVAAHIAAAVIHMRRRDGTIQRMLPK